MRLFKVLLSSCLIGSVSQADTLIKSYQKDCESPSCWHASAVVNDNRNQAFIQRFGGESFVYVTERGASYGSSDIKKLDLTAGTPGSPFFTVSFVNEQELRVAGSKDSNRIGVASLSVQPTGVGAINAKFRLLSDVGATLFEDGSAITGITQSQFSSNLKLLSSKIGRTFALFVDTQPNAKFVFFDVANAGASITKFGAFTSSSFGAPKDIGLSPDGRYFVAAYTGRLDIIDLDLIRAGNSLASSSQQIFLQTLTSSIQDIDISSDNKIVACGLSAYSTNFIAQTELIRKSVTGAWISQPLSIPSGGPIGSLCNKVAFNQVGDRFWAVIQSADSKSMVVALITSNNMAVVQTVSLGASETGTLWSSDVDVIGNRLALSVRASTIPGVVDGENLFILDATKRRGLVARTSIAPSTGLADVSISSDLTKVAVFGRTTNGNRLEVFDVIQ
jgi:hypothetical protein